jgi:zinc protease
MKAGSRLCLLLLCLACLLPGSPVVAAELTETVLPNGMRVILMPVHTNPVVSSAILVRAGVAWEPEGLSGASHFLEHLLFNGTTTRTQEELYADVDMIGAYNNATTRSDHTLYLLLAPSEHLDAALEIQADMLLNSTLPPEKFEKEKGIVIEEMGRGAADPGNLAGEYFDSRLYAGSVYARPVLGSIDSITSLKREDVLDYYKQRYVPNRMVLFLAGDFDPASVLQNIERHFGSGDEAATGIDPDHYIPSVSIPFAAETTVSHHQLEGERTYLHVAFPAPAVGDTDAADFGLMVDLLGSGDASPLGRALEGQAEPVVFDYSLYHETSRGMGTLVFSASLTGAQPPEEVVRLVVSTMIQAVREHMIDPEALRRLRESELTDDVTLEEQIHYYAMFRAPRFLHASAAEVVEEQSHGASGGIEGFEALVNRYLIPARAVVTLSGPDQEEGLSSSLDLSDVGTLAGGEQTTRSTAPDVVVLKNGLTVAIGTEPDSRVLGVHLIARNRSALEPAERSGLADLVHHLLLKGTLARDVTGVTEALSGLGANVQFHDNPRFPFDDYRTTPLYSFATMEARADRATEALRLFAEILQTPRFAPKEIERMVDRMRAQAERGITSSRAVSSRLLYQQIAAGHPLSHMVGGSLDSLDGVSRDDVTRMYERLLAPENLILTIRGSGTNDTMLQHVKEIFGGQGAAGGWMMAEGEATEAIGSTAPTALTAPPAVPETAGRAEEQIGKRQSYLRLGTVLEVRKEDRPALAAANLILSDRLQMDLREKQGLAYSIGSGVTELGGGHQLLSVSIGTAAENLEQAESEIRRVVSELREGPIPVEELQQVIAARRGRILMRRLPRKNQAFYDGLDLLYGVPSGGSLEFLEGLGAITTADVAAAVTRYVDADTWSVAIAR